MTARGNGPGATGLTRCTEEGDQPGEHDRFRSVLLDELRRRHRYIDLRERQPPVLPVCLLQARATFFRLANFPRSSDVAG